MSEIQELAPSGASWNKRMDAVARYMLLGNMRVVSEQVGVTYNQLVEWKRSPWWPEMVETIRRQKKGKTNQSITKIIEQSLDVIEDRLENGDFIMNNKTGEIVRKPVGVKEATTIAHQLLQRQQAIEELEAKLSSNEDTVQETLSLLAKEFQKWNKTKRVSKDNENAEDLPFVEIIDAVHDQREARLQEGSGEIYEQT